MPRDTESHRVAKKGRRTIAKKVGKEPSKFEKYWKAGKKQAGLEEEQIDELAAGGKEPRDPHAYAMAIALRRAQKTGSKPHKKLTRESFEDTLNDALDNLAEAGLKCPKCGSDDVLAGTKDMKNHCSACGHEWGEGEEPKKMKEGKEEEEADIGEEATTAGGVAGDVSYGPAKKKRKPGNGGGRYIKKDWDITSHESIDKIADIISEDVSVNNGFVFDDEIDESYNDNYLRPNQRERRTNLRQADGTQPPGSLEDDVITEYPGEEEDAADAASPEDMDIADRIEKLRAEAQRRGIRDKGGLIALAQELFSGPTESQVDRFHRDLRRELGQDTILKDPEILATLSYDSGNS